MSTTWLLSALPSPLSLLVSRLPEVDSARSALYPVPPRSVARVRPLQVCLREASCLAAFICNVQSPGGNLPDSLSALSLSLCLLPSSSEAPPARVWGFLSVSVVLVDAPVPLALGLPSSLSLSLQGDVRFHASTRFFLQGSAVEKVTLLQTRPVVC